MQAHVSTVVLPTPLGFTAARGLGLQEAQHLAGTAMQRLNTEAMVSMLLCSFQADFE